MESLSPHSQIEGAESVLLVGDAEAAIGQQLQKLPEVKGPVGLQDSKRARRWTTVARKVLQRSLCQSCLSCRLGLESGRPSQHNWLRQC